MNRINILHHLFINKDEPLDDALKSVMQMNPHKPLSERYLKWVQDTNQKT